MNDDDMIAVYFTPAEIDLVLDGLVTAGAPTNAAGDAIDVVLNAMMCAYGG